MRLVSSALLLGLMVGSFAPTAAAKEKDKDKDKKQRSSTANYRVDTGSCDLGTAQKDLDGNNVRARLFNVGNLFWKGDPAVYQVPKSGDASAVYTSGVWVGGFVDNELRVAGSRYADYEYWPGPLDENGNPPADCSEFDRIYKVSIADIATAVGGGGLAPDLRDWPTELGAPTLAAPGNGFDDDGDGDVDEGSDGIDNDGDESIDERDEQERIDPAVRLADGRPIYDFAAGDRPELIGTQSAWWVMNDAGNVHAETGSRPIGIEVQAQAWAFARADDLNNTTFYRWKIIYKGDSPLRDTFVGIFSDIDLGEAGDDYIGSQPELGIGYVYNADNDDESDNVPGYGTPPPALGYDFFQGPIVPSEDGMSQDTLGMTRFTYYNNGSGSDGDPSNAQEYYNYMTGFWKDGLPFTEGGTGRGGSVPVDFVYPGFPGDYWSELDNDNSGGDNPAGDRRFILSSGPFDMEPGDVQEIVFGIVWAQGADNISSVSAMFNADILAQRAYDLDFELAAPPPAPAVSSVELDNEVILRWDGYDVGFEEFNKLLEGLGLADTTYNFEGFNVYRYDSAGDNSGDLVATYDLSSGPGRVIDQAPDPATGELNFFVAAEGSNSGIQTFHVIEEDLTNYRDYYYGVSAYAFNSASVPKVLEGEITRIRVRPTEVVAGSSVQTRADDLISFERVEGRGVASISARVVDPLSVTDEQYELRFYTVVDSSGADPVDVQVYDVYVGDEIRFSGSDFYNRLGRVPDQGEVVVAGLALPIITPQTVPAADADGVPDFAGNGSGIGKQLLLGEMFVQRTLPIRVASTTVSIL